MDDYDFSDLKPNEKRAFFDGELFIVREASEGAAVTYQNMVARSFKTHEGKVVGVENPADVEPRLVADCTYKTDKETGKILYASSGMPVTVEITRVQKWPHSQVKKMFDWIIEVSDLLKKKSKDASDSEPINLSLSPEEKKAEEDKAKN